MKHRRSDSRLHRGRRLDVSLREDERDWSFASRYPEQPVARDIEHKTLVRLDQGRQGACVGFGRAHGYATEPGAQLTTERIARFFYEGAKRHDSRPGEDYEGTTPNGLYKFLRSLGLIRAWYRIRTWDEFAVAIQKGGVDLAAPWREGCFDPGRGGIIRYTGKVRGGHFVHINGIAYSEGLVSIVQSWGRDHGQDGIVLLPIDDLKAMMRDGGMLYAVEENDISGLRAKPKPKRRWWQFWK